MLVLLRMQEHGHPMLRARPQKTALLTLTDQ